MVAGIGKIPNTCVKCGVIFYVFPSTSHLRRCSFECRKVPILESFLKTGWDVLQSGCWEWKGRRMGGYGVLGHTKLAHRISWEHHRDKIPEGMNVLHHCDNPPCVNPDHLFIGTLGDNNRDRSQKGRTRTSIGEKRPLSKLKEGDITAIRSVPEYRGVCARLAEAYGVSLNLIWQIRRRKVWRHVG